MELLIQVTTATPPTVHPVGDVIAAMPNGHAWGRMELANENWRIVRVPEMSENEGTSLAAGEIPQHASHRPRLRGMAVDVAALNLPATVRSGLGADIEIPLTEFRVACGVKPVGR